MRARSRSAPEGAARPQRIGTRLPVCFVSAVPDAACWALRGLKYRVSVSVSETGTAQFAAVTVWRLWVPGRVCIAFYEPVFAMQISLPGFNAWKTMVCDGHHPVN